MFAESLVDSQSWILSCYPAPSIPPSLPPLLYDAEDKIHASLSQLAFSVCAPTRVEKHRKQREQDGYFLGSFMFLHVGLFSPHVTFLAAVWGSFVTL